MVAYNGKHIILEIPQHRILCDIRDNQKIKLGNGIVPKNLNQVILALIESWVYLDPSKRADLINVTLDSDNDSHQEKDLSEYVKSYPISDEQVIADFNKTKAEAEELFSDKSEFKNRRWK